MWTKFLLSILTAALPLLGTCTATGCMAFDPAGQIKSLLAEPAVQATLQDWAAKGSAHNPRIGGQMVTGFEIFTIGVDVEGDISGSAGTSGLDPALLEKLTEIAKKNGYQPPTTQPATTPLFRDPDNREFRLAPT